MPLVVDISHFRSSLSKTDKTDPASWKIRWWLKYAIECRDISLGRKDLLFTNIRSRKSMRHQMRDAALKAREAAGL